jgi:catechol 2,3-dioxygenase-like lactoylglutathione lyase family enzyme
MYLIPLFALISYSQINTDNNIFTEKRNNQSLKNTDMKLGAFSISLSVKDLEKSKSFYQNLGFEILAGAMDKNYLIMKNENSLIGLFQGMFEGNILTFNPGWDEDAKEVNSFDDVRKIQQHLKSQEINLESEVDESTTGPASFMVKDPDGNLILIDQHR